MPPEGMVHALETIHALLAPDGILIDLHPDGQPPPFEISIAGQSCFLGYMQESDDFVEYAQAEAALAQVVQRGLFKVEEQGAFPFIIRADSFEELHAHLMENWSDAVIPDEIGLRAQELSLLKGQIEYAQLIEMARIARLRKISQV
jgi:hypothetical protein